MGRIKDLATQIRSFLTDDFHDADGATAGSRKISPFDAHGQFRNALAPRGGVAIDIGGAGSFTATLTNQSILTDPCALVWTGKWTHNTAEYPCLSYVGPSSTTAASNNTLWIRASNGSLNVTIFGATTLDYNSWATTAATMLPFKGKVIQIIAVRNASGNPTIYVNGVDFTANGSFSSGGTPPTWQGSITSTYYVNGRYNNGNSFDGTIYSASLYNLALSASDVQEIFELGGAVPDRFKAWGSQVAKYTSDFSAGLDSWAASSGGCTNAGNVNGINGQNAWQSSQRTSTTGALQLARNMTTPLSGVNVRGGAILTLAFRVFNSSSTTRYFGFGFAGYGNDAVPAIPTAVPAGAQVDVVFNRIVRADEPPYLYDCRVLSLTSAGGSDSTIPTGDVFYFKNITLTVRGAVVHLPLDDGLGFQLQDISTNRLHALMTTTGVSHVAPLYGPAHIRTTTNTNGNQQLCGGTVLPATSQILRVRARSQTGTPSVTLGTASGGSQVVASVALSTTWKDLTIALTGGINTSANSLWAGSNSTDVVEWDVTWEPLSI